MRDSTNTLSDSDVNEKNTESDSSPEDPHDATFVLETPAEENAASTSTRETPYRNIVRDRSRLSGPKNAHHISAADLSNALPTELKNSMDKVLSERKAILRKALSLCSDLRHANFGTVIRTINHLMKDKNFNSKAASEQTEIDDIKLQVTNMINNQSKKEKLSKFDEELDRNSDRLRELSMKFRKIIQSLKKRNSDQGQSQGKSPNEGNTVSTKDYSAHPANLFMDLKNLELEHHELLFQNEHLCCQLDQVFNAWQRIVSINRLVMGAYNKAYQALDFHDNLTYTIRENHEKVLRESAMSVGFAKVGLAQTKFIRSKEEEAEFTRSGIDPNPPSNEMNSSDSENEDTNNRATNPLRGISRTFSSLFSLPSINSATGNISCENWIVDDELLKKLVFEGLNSCSKNREEEEEDDNKVDLSTSRVSIYDENAKKKRNSRKSLIQYSFVPSSNLEEGEEGGEEEENPENEAQDDETIIITPKSIKNRHQTPKPIDPRIKHLKDLNIKNGTQTPDREDTEELMRDTLSSDISPAQTNVYAGIEDKENSMPDDDQTFVISQPSNMDVSIVKLQSPTKGKKRKQQVAFE